MFSDGFTDLRMNHQQGQGDDSFWPSFTDIMTVIVMIFLLAMVVVMMRNSELINQLRQTVEAERAAIGQLDRSGHGLRTGRQQRPQLVP